MPYFYYINAKVTVAPYTKIVFAPGVHLITKSWVADAGIFVIAWFVLKLASVPATAFVEPVW